MNSHRYYQHSYYYSEAVANLDHTCQSFVIIGLDRESDEIIYDAQALRGHVGDIRQMLRKLQDAVLVGQDSRCNDAEPSALNYSLHAGDSSPDRHQLKRRYFGDVAPSYHYNFHQYLVVGQKDGGKFAGYLRWRSDDCDRLTTALTQAIKTPNHVWLSPLAKTVVEAPFESPPEDTESDKFHAFEWLREQAARGEPCAEVLMHEIVRLNQEVRAA